MADVRELVRQRVGDLGLALSDLSKKVGRNHAYLQQYLERHVPRKLPEDVREKLAPLIGLSPDQLRSATTPQGAVHPATFLKVPPIDQGDKVPVMGTAEGGPEGWTLFNGDVVDYVDRPPSLASAPNGYAVYVTGSSMAPRYRPGEVVYVHPGRPVTDDCYVLVQMQPRQQGEPPLAVIKRLVKKTGLKLILEQTNPRKTIELALKDVISIHRIVGSGES